MRWLRIGSGVFLFILSAISLWESIVPAYRFQEPSPFSGEKWYNPFAGDTLKWQRANFHIHSKNRLGITPGYQDVPTILRVYDSLGFQCIGISDYQCINPRSPIPLYEHGWNIGKVHQLCFWAKEVKWIDFPLLQTLSTKQFMIEFLRPTSSFLVLAHPRFLHSYTGDELKYLGGYDAIECLNRYGDSIAEWDSALSAGHYAPILAHDNVHDVYNPHQIASRWTEIAIMDGRNKDALKEALLAGRTVGYKNRTPFPITSSYPLFRQIQMRGNTLFVQVSQKVDTLRVVGQGGRVRAWACSTDSLSYEVTPGDTYLRVEAYTPNVEAYTSPLVRGGPKRRPIPPRDVLLTFIRRGFFILVGVALLFLSFFLLRLFPSKGAILPQDKPPSPPLE
ncbi:MAG: hypothetical protein RMJ66_00450 [Bacteroidia bacterium]|nr:hypothetical protein [Bacteroidia bacterium]MDW8133514.1 hypothetical protein [Bacteroidia bacterium]